MSPWYQAANDTEPGTHALVIGVSRYRYLPDSLDDDPPAGAGETFGLGNVTTPAISAWRFAQWLTAADGFNQPEAPLASVRLLLSPSSAEIAETPALGGLDAAGVAIPTRDSVLDALFDWQQACNRHRDNIAILYVAGHGIQLTKDDSLVLLHDFARARRPILDAAMDIGSIWRGMATADAASRQYYFVDACRTRPGLFDDYLTTPAGVALDISKEGTVDSAPIFYSASPRTLALGLPARGTLFCQALLDCLNGNAAELDAAGRWVVGTSALLRHLPATVERLAERYQATQTAVVGGQLRDAVFHRLREAPEVSLDIRVSPAETAGRAHCTVADLGGRTVYDREPIPAEIALNIKAGLYALQLAVRDGDGDSANVLRPFMAMPPAHREEIRL